ncbi:hypothetical protein LAUMK41_02683 [Mycobacterium attenuatum]|nr:hypothetical protein LAUMK41_02683 [Mycobacterium attenuatum]
MYPSIDLGDAESHLGADTYRRGLDYARKGRVVRCSWNPGNDSLTGSVRGNRGRAYTTTAHSSSVVPKELVAAELPAKQEQLLDIELPPRHHSLYDKRLQRERQRCSACSTTSSGQVRARLGTQGIDYCYLDGRTRNLPKVIQRF